MLLAGRALLGVAESFIITGAVAWGMALVGPRGTGRVIAWVGMAMFAALACGAPAGTMLYSAGGLGAVAAAAPSWRRFELRIRKGDAALQQDSAPIGP